MNYNVTVLEIEYHGDTLRIALQGHPTDCLSYAHSLASDILANGPSWRINEITYRPSQYVDTESRMWVRCVRKG